MYPIMRHSGTFLLITFNAPTLLQCRIHCMYLYTVILTAPSMMRTMSHLKVQMQMSEGGQLRGTWDRVQTGHKKMARKPVSNSWLSQPEQNITRSTVKFSTEEQTKLDSTGHTPELRGERWTDLLETALCCHIFILKRNYEGFLP